MTPEEIDAVLREARQMKTTNGIPSADASEMCALMSSFPENFEIFDTPLDDPDKSRGFTLVNSNTWLPAPLFNARQRQQHKMARGKGSQ